MKRLLARLESIEATGALGIDVNWVNGNQRILFHSVRTASAYGVREMAAPRRHLALVCSCTRRGATRSTRPSTCTASSSTGIGSSSKVHLDDMLKAQRHAVDRGSSSAIVGSAPCCLIPASATTSCGPRLLSIVPEEQPARGPVRPGELDAGATVRPASRRRPSGTPG